LTGALARAAALPAEAPFAADFVVAVRFAGCSVAGVAFVAATYTLSVLPAAMGMGMRPCSRLYGLSALIFAGSFAAYRMRPP
jgi:hypothetical protein